jgi:hypothetical protein
MPHSPRFYQYCSPEDENKTSVHIEEIEAYLIKAI